MIKTVLQITSILFLPLYVVFCGSAPVVVADGTIERDLIETTGLTAQAAKAARGKDQLTLHDAYALAAERTESLALRVEDVEQARERVNQAIGRWLPQVRAQGLYLVAENADFINSIGQGTGIRFLARQNILTGLDEWAGLTAARHHIDALKQDLAFEAGRLYLSLAAILVERWQLESSIRAREEIILLTKNTEGELRRRVRLGRSRTAELLQVEAQNARNEAELQSLRERLIIIDSELRRITGFDKPVQWQEEPQLPDKVLKENELSRLVQTRPDIKAAENYLLLAKAQRQAAEGRHMPNIYMTGNYRVRTEETFRGPDFIGQIVAEIPLFEGGTTQARVREMLSKERQAELTLRSLQRTAEEEIRRSYAAWQNSLRERDAYAKAETLARSSYRQNSNEYRLNLVTNLEVLNALASLQTAREQYERARLAVLFNRIWYSVAIAELPYSLSRSSQESP